MSALASVHTKLLGEMGTPREDGFNPIAPRSHRALMDVRYQVTTRILGWALWKTVDLDKYGRLGPKKLTRTSRAHDERGFLVLKHLALDLDLRRQNASAALRAAVEEGLVGVDEKGRIYPRGDAPDPVRIKGEDGGEDDEGFVDAEGDERICTYYMPKALVVYLQSLEKKMAHRWAADYRRIEEHRKRMERDAIAAVRARHDEIRKSWLGTIGVAGEEPARGRPRVERQGSSVQLTFTSLPELSVQLPLDDASDRSPDCHSVQNEYVHITETHSVQDSVRIPSSLLTSSESLQSSSELSPPTPSLTRAREGSASEQTPPRNSNATEGGASEPNSASYWKAFLNLCRTVGMRCTTAEEAANRRRFEELSAADQKAAIQGVEIRDTPEVGEYSELRFIPTMERYLRYRLWEAPLRPRESAQKPTQDTSFLDAYAAGVDRATALRMSPAERADAIRQAKAARNGH